MYVRKDTLSPTVEEDLDQRAALPGEIWPDIERELAERGWKVRARHVWAVEIHRDGECEETLAPSRDEAYVRLRELARVYDAGHLP